MTFTKIKIDDAVRREFPDARIGWLLAGVEVRESDPYVDGLKAALPDVLARHGLDDSNLASHPDVARWREAFSAMGAKPSKYRSSLEALLRRVAKGQEMWNVSSVVDCYNCVSVATLLAMGAHDTAKIDGAITLRHGRADEKFLPLGDGGEVVDVDPRNILYADESKVCCWLWCHRDTRLASISEETKEAVFIIDSAFTPKTTDVETGIEQLAGHLEKIGCKAKTGGIL